MPRLLFPLLALAAGPALAEPYPFEGDWAQVPDGTVTVDRDLMQQICREHFFTRIYPDGLVNTISRVGTEPFTVDSAMLCTLEGDTEHCTDGHEEFTFHTYRVGSDMMVSCEMAEALRDDFELMLSQDPPQMVYNPCLVLVRCDAPPDAAAPVRRREVVR